MNLGFVINVIEDPIERVKTLKTAFSLAKKLLVVTVMLDAEAKYVSGQPFGDGFKSSTGTFQKFYDNREIIELINSTLSRQTIPVATGTYYIFKNDSDETNFLDARSSSRVSIEEIVKWSLPSDKNLRTFERNKELLINFWKEILSKGRLPRKDETPLAKKVTSTIGSVAKAYKIIASEEKAAALEIEAERR